MRTERVRSVQPAVVGIRLLLRQIATTLTHAFFDVQCVAASAFGGWQTSVVDADAQVLLGERT